MTEPVSYVVRLRRTDSAMVEEMPASRDSRRVDAIELRGIEAMPELVALARALIAERDLEIARRMIRLETEMCQREAWLASRKAAP